MSTTYKTPLTVALCSLVLLIAAAPATLGSDPAPPPDVPTRGDQLPSAFVIAQPTVPPTVEVVEPLANGETVESFVNYDSGWWKSSFPHGDILRSDVSNAFFYKGPNGISLVFLHDDIKDGGGGEATINMTGLPAQGSWVVKDDPFDDYADDDAHWRWGPDRIDGGAYQGDMTNLTLLTIQATFEEARGGQIEAWHFLSGDPADPDRIELDPSLPLVVAGVD